jgi:phosphate transport system protein
MDNKTHISTLFDRDLNALNVKMRQLSETAIAQYADSIDALTTRDEGKLEKLISKDGIIDDLEDEIHEQALQIIALRAPRAEDLRSVLAVMKTASIFERIGDYARNIANRVKVIGTAEPEADPGVDMTRMAKVALGMLRDMQAAFFDHDVDMAIDVWNRDVEVDQFHTAMHKDLLAVMVDNPETTAIGVHYLFIAKNIERIGDYTTDIAEQLYFLVNGDVLSGGRPKADVTSQSLGLSQAEE